MTKSRDLICQRLRSVGLEQKLTLQILDQVEKWLSCSGSEWTVKRLKEYKNWFVNVRANTGLKPPSWISHKSGLPKGVFGTLFKRGLASDKSFRFILQALMSYTAFTSTELTDSQAKKFREATESEQPRESVLDFPRGGDILLEINRIARDCVRNYINSTHDEFYVWFDRKKACPVSSFLGMGKYARTREEKFLAGLNSGYVREALVGFLLRPDVAFGSALVDDDFWLEGGPPPSQFDSPIAPPYLEKFRERFRSTHEVIKRWPTSNAVVQDEVSAVVSSFILPKSQLIGHQHDWVGNIACIQEPGFKARFIANPHPILQYVTSRLAKSLYTTLASIEQDWHKDQEGGLKSCQLALKSSIPLDSIDLSSATDRFPRVIQYALLDEMVSYSLDMAMAFMEKDSELFTRYMDINMLLTSEISTLKKVIEGSYEVPAALVPKLGRKQIRWMCGQPLGCQSSFALFSLAHHAVIRSLDPTFYAILGDDLVVDQETGLKHRRWLEDCGIPFSPEKSITSSDMAEFAGHLVTKNDIIPQVKLKPTTNDNFIEQARKLGPKSANTGMFTRKQQKVLQILGDALPEHFPLGLNWNTNGRSYSDRVKLSVALQAQMKKHELDHVSFDSRSMYTILHAWSSKTSSRLRKTYDVHTHEKASHLPVIEERKAPTTLEITRRLRTLDDAQRVWEKKLASSPTEHFYAQHVMRRVGELSAYLDLNEICKVIDSLNTERELVSFLECFSKHVGNTPATIRKLMDVYGNQLCIPQSTFENELIRTR